MHHISIRHYVFLAFQPELARKLGSGFAFACNIIVIGNSFGANETFFKIGVDDASRGRSLGALGDGPSTGFFRAYGEIGKQAEQLITRANDTVQTGLAQSNGIE